MDVDVVIPVYGGASTIARAVTSVLAQRGIDGALRVIVVDDASPDAAAEVVAALAQRDPRVTLVRQAQNGGVAQARNVGIAAGRAELVAFLDQDDAWPEGSLAARVAALAADPALGYVTGLQRILVDEGAERPAWVRPEWLERPQAGIIPGALLARRATLDAVGGFDASLRYGGDDPDWFARARAAGVPTRSLDEVVLLRYVHASNRSAHAGTSADLLDVVRRHLARGSVETEPGA